MMLTTWMKRGELAAAQATSFNLPLELEDTQTLKVQKLILRSGGLMLLVATIWAALTPIRELAVAPGVVVPKGEVRAVQHLEGGIVDQIFHRAGDAVMTGDPIVRLSDGQAGGDLDQLRVRLSDLEQQQTQLSRLIATMDKEGKGADQSEDLRKIHEEVLKTRLRERDEERSTLKSRISQKSIEIANLEHEAAILTQLVKMREQMLREEEALFEKGLTTRRAQFEDRAALEQSRIQFMSVTGQLAKAKEELVEARSRLEASDASALRSWSEELSKVTAEADELRESIAKQQDRFDRLIVRAPVDGVVQFLAVKSIGEVIKPGESFLKIVPTGVPMQAEVQIKPDDIGSVRIGDVAEMRVTAFDASLFGKVTGKIDSISPTSFQRENGDYYYLAAVSFASDELPGRRKIAPGMIVSAEIVTGAKSFLRYMLKPIFKILDPAFSER